MAINDISLTSGMRSNLLSLQETVNLLNRTQDRLSTGKKVNSAIDNPVSYFASQNLTSRASKIDSLKDAMGQAVQTITAADEGITAITAMIEQAKGIAQAALSAEGPTTPTAITNGTANMQVTAYTTASITFGVVGVDENVVIDGETFSNTTGDWDGTATDLAADINANTTLQGLGYSAAVVSGDVIISMANADVDLGDLSGTATGYAEAIDTQHSETWTITNSNGTTYTGTGAGDTAAASKTAAAAALQADLLADTTWVNTATVDNAGVVNATFNTVQSAEMTSLQAQYNEMRTQITELAEDSGYKGKNLLTGGTLDVKFEGSTLTVQGFTATAAGLGITAADWSAGTAAIDADLVFLDTALDTLSQESSKMAGNLSIITVRQDFSTNMVNTLTEGSDKLVLADTNEEGANMLMLQTRQSLATTALSLSAQAAQSVLKLFS